MPSRNTSKRSSKFHRIALSHDLVMNSHAAKSFQVAALQAFLIAYLVLECQSSTSKGFELTSVRAPTPYIKRSHPFYFDKRQRYCHRTGAYLMACRPPFKCDVRTFGKGVSVFAFPDRGPLCQARKKGKWLLPALVGNCYAGCHFEKTSRMRCEISRGRPVCFSARRWNYKEYR